MSFYGVTDLWTYVIGAFGIILLPGPNSLYVLSVATVRGVKAGYQGACGVFVGDTILMVLSATGVASVLKGLPALFFVLKYAGAAYLAWIGLAMLWGAGQALRHPTLDTPPRKVDSRQPFQKALVISLLNPKAILFFVSFFIQFVDPGYAHPGLSFLILGLIVQVCSVFYLSVLIFAGVRLAAQFRRHRRLAAGVTAGVGGMFIGFGARLATATLG